MEFYFKIETEAFDFVLAEVMSERSIRC